ncbi:MAG: type II secretion system minor pseudopilin GspK [Betaproteobacteria bacterium]|nr:type II secretion system minor pseudopilin GspK [Betaproteobacteria bacterium]
MTVHNRLQARRRQRGLALIVAMLVAALAAAVAVSLAGGESMWSSRVLHRRDQVQAQSIAQAGIQWARQILAADAQGGPIDSLNEPWALPLPATPVENGTVEGAIVDAQGLFNVNDLASPVHGSAERKRFARLFASLGLPASALPPIVAWVVRQRTQATPATEGPRPGAPQAGSPGVTGVLRVQELAEIPGITVATLAALVPRVSALPLDVPLNVNTAAPELLAASISDLDGSALAALVEGRSTRPFTSVADFRARLPSGASLGDETMYSVGSRYFLVSVRARQGETLAQAHALIERSGSGWPTVVWQTIE